MLLLACCPLLLVTAASSLFFYRELLYFTFTECFFIYSTYYRVLALMTLLCVDVPLINYSIIQSIILDRYSGRVLRKAPGPIRFILLIFALCCSQANPICRPTADNVDTATSLVHWWSDHRPSLIRLIQIKRHQWIWITIIGINKLGLSNVSVNCML